jgi:hypothetical protein
MNTDEVIHWSDWASQPSVQIACTKELHFPWQLRKDLPPHVHEIPVEGEPSILYTFDPRLVTCPECAALEHCQNERERMEAFYREHPEDDS